MAKPADPLADVVFLKIPEELAARLSGALPPTLLIPCERPSGGHGEQTVTIESIIAGMLRVLIYRPDHPDAASYAGIVRELRPGIREEFTQAGRIKAEKKDFPMAIEIFRALVALFPGDPVCTFNLALVYHDASREAKGEEPGRAEEYAELAFAAYHSALERDDALPDTILNFGFFLLDQENYEKALAQFEEYLRRETDEGKKEPVRKIVSNLSSSQEQDLLFKEAFDDVTLGREEDGIRKVTAVLAVHPDFWNGWFLLGWGNRRVGRYREAKDAFLKALSLAPPKPDLLNELAIVHMELGEFDESYQRLSDALKLEPDNPKVLSNLGVVSFKLNQTDEAAGYFKAVLEMNGHDPVALSYLEKLEKK